MVVLCANALLTELSLKGLIEAAETSEAAVVVVVTGSSPYLEAEL